MSTHPEQPEQPEIHPETPWLRRFPLRTPTLPPATHTNVYIVGQDDLLVVDAASPYPAEQARLLVHLQRLAGQGQRVQALLLTHHHLDHCGGTAALQQALAVPLWAHRETASRVARLGLRVDRLLEEGDALPVGMHVMHTPGHAPGHLCLVGDAAAGMIVGDMVASVGTIVIDPDDDGDMGVYLAQLQRLLTLAESGPRRLWPAHGTSVADGPALLRFYLQHRLLREAKVRAALAQATTHDHGATLAELLPLAYDDVPPAIYPLAARALRAHLLKLAAEGAARQSAGRWWG